MRMKRRSGGLVAIAGWLCCVGAADAGSLSGWIQFGDTPAPYRIAIDQAEKRTGASSAAIRCDTAGAEGFGALVQIIKADAYRGRRLRLTGHLKSEDLQRLAGLSMRVDGLRASQLAFDNMADRAVKGTTPWTRYEVVLDVPTDAATIMFGFYQEGHGRVWADDLALEVVGLDVPVTDMELEPGVLESPWPATGGQPGNLGFEE